MGTPVRVHFLITLITFTADYVHAFHSGAPCSSQFTMSPSAIFHGVPQNTQTRPPPYKFEITDLHDVPVKTYKAQLYKIRLTASRIPFRGFLVQVRPSTKEGYPIGHLRAGEFVRDLTWSSQGIQIQLCPSTFNDSITHAQNSDKTALEVLWKATKNYGPLLFIITLVQNRSTFWTQWLPPSGFLLPDEIGFKLNTAEIGKSELPNKSPDENPTLKVNPNPLAQITQITVESIAASSQEFSIRPKFHATTPAIGIPDLNVVRSTQISVSSGPLRIVTNTAVEEVTVKQLSLITPEVTFQELPTSTVTQDTTTLFQFRTVVPTTESNSESTQSTSSTVSSVKWEQIFTSDFSKPEISTEENRVSPEILEGLSILTNKSDIDFCIDYPCYNNGTCKNVPAEDRFECVCTSRWTGKQCEIENNCENHQCHNGADCINGDESYTCKCKKEWAGEFCDRNCPSYLCDNGGTCILTDGGRGYGCACAPGWTGDRCRSELDLCVSQPCQHGGTCIRKFNGFTCTCTNGYMGETCHRPCQDIYGSCVVWSEEERCESMRQSTKFFDTNCAATCKQCVFDNTTLLAEVPLPPVLEPFDFILGRWTLNASTVHRFPLDFSNSSLGYHEEMVFSATPVPMFGTPSVNYSAIAKSNRDSTDIHVNVGFLTLKPLTKPLKVSLMSTGNNGITVIEEGMLNGTELTLTTQYFAILPQVDNKAPAVVKRIFSLTNEFYLRETVERLGNDGQKDYFTKYYFKETKFAPF